MNMLRTAIRLLPIFILNVPWAGSNVLRLATTTSTYETGLLDTLLPAFEKANSLKVHVISVGTGKAIKLGERGDVDCILVHARQAEDTFVERSFGVNRRDVMVNDFILLGPKEDPAGISGKTTATALKKIAAAQAPFVSRGDESGTHKKERALWKISGISPQGKWFMAAGQGMSATLRIADEKNAYVLSDRASWLAAKPRMRLAVLVQGGAALKNPYGIIAVSPYKHPHVKYREAMALIAYLTAPHCQALIKSFRKSGQVLFQPNAAPVQSQISSQLKN